MQYNQMQIIKRRFFAMRNGIIADTLRKAGLDYRMIFGLNLPQITDIAADLPHTPRWPPSSGPTHALARASSSPRCSIPSVK